MLQGKKVLNKGTVGVESYRGKLRLRLPRTLGLKKRYISTGLMTRQRIEKWLMSWVNRLKKILRQKN